MTTIASTGLCNKLLDTGSLRTILSGGFVHIYAGTIPATADASIGAATLLCTLTESGDGTTGLTLEAAAVDGTISKTTTEVWSGTNVAGGVAAFYRHVAVGDTGASSTTQARLQGDVKTANGAMNLTAGTTLTNGAPFLLNSYFASLPTQA